MTERGKIERNLFFSRFRNRLRFIESIQSIESYILACVHLDSLSVHRYGGRSSSDKFGRFLVNYSDFGKNFNQVSLPLLIYHLEELPGVYGSLSGALRQIFGVEEGDFIREDHTVDLDIASFRSKIIKDFNESEIEHICGMAKKFQYHSIFWWKYRCCLVHRGTLPIDELIGVDEKPYPFYYSELELSTQRSFIRFKISRIFLIDTLKECIKRFEGDELAPILTE